MRPLRTPGIQAFLHMLPVMCILWFLVDVQPLTGAALKGLAPTAALAGLQVIPSQISRTSTSRPQAQYPLNAVCKNTDLVIVRDATGL